MNNMSQIMKQAKAMQEKMTEVQKKIEEMEVEGSSGGGAVKVIMNGRHELKKIDIDSDSTWNQLGKKNKNRLINVLMNDVYEVSGKTTFKEEFVTCGGVSLSNINMQTMESKLHAGIYFAGEILDIDGVTGGFNFQAAWTTGFLAGKNSTS